MVVQYLYIPPQFILVDASLASFLNNALAAVAHERAFPCTLTAVQPVRPTVY